MAVSQEKKHSINNMEAVLKHFYNNVYLPSLRTQYIDCAVREDSVRHTMNCVLRSCHKHFNEKSNEDCICCSYPLVGEVCECPECGIEIHTSCMTKWLIEKDDTKCMYCRNSMLKLNAGEEILPEHNFPNILTIDSFVDIIMKNGNSKKTLQHYKLYKEWNSNLMSISDLDRIKNEWIEAKKIAVDGF